MKNKNNFSLQSSPITIIIFGASGDLTKRKIIPALFNSYKKDRLPEVLNIIGFARRPWSSDDFRTKIKEGMLEFSANSFEQGKWESFTRNIHYVQGNLDNKDDYVKLDSICKKIEDGQTHRLYYMATSPHYFVPIAENLGLANMADEKYADRNIIIEKPFGRDLTTALELDKTIHRVFKEHQIFRIDHYLGKETAQNILIFRFANSIFEPLWNRTHIDNIQITFAEKVGIEHRAGYYDKAGVLRDMFQNHLLQLLSLITMEPPASFDADAVRNEKVKVLKSIRKVDLNDTVRSQYNGYNQSDGVAPDSKTPTYSALKLYIDNWRWKGVPIYLRSGKALSEKSSKIIIEFQKPPHQMFDFVEDEDFTPNILSISVQPDEGIHLKFEAKVPDSDRDTRSVNMDFKYSTSFKKGELPDAYERLLLNAIQGDASLFTRSDGIEAAWKIIDPILEGWENTDSPPLTFYNTGSCGPKEADELLKRDGRIWREGCSERKKE